ncbi:MAG: SAM-dependent methyltransferase [Pseudomonadota bacterium]
MPARPPRPPLLSVALLSAAALAYEILLMRLFSIIQWHHFAYMIISLALLGYGASGAFLALTRRWLQGRFAAAYLANLILFSLSAIACFFAAQQVPFHPEMLLWDPRQPLRLLLVYLLLAFPFFFAANGVALALMHFRGQITRLYAANLLGSGLGSLGIVGILFLLFPHRALAVIGGLGALAAAAAAATGELRRQARAWVIAGLAAGFIPLAWFAVTTPPVLSPYKELSQTLRIPGARVIAERSSPLGLITVVESPLIPLRYAPGLSLNAGREPPAQLGVFTDGDAMTVINRNTGAREALAYLDQLTSALPYHLSRPQRVLILGAGGGSDVLQARYHGVPHIEAVELNPQIVALVRDEFSEFAGGLYRAPGVGLHIAEARGFVRGRDAHYDLIQIALLDSFSAAGAGLHALSESYLYTVEAFDAYLRRLAPGGYLAFTRWVRLPPRDTLKLFATAVEALRRAGVPDPELRLVLIRGWQTSTLLVKNGPVSPREIAALRRFCATRAFDVAYYPGIAETEVNRYNVLTEPYFYLGAKALLGEERESFLARYKFNLAPATDDRPYFFHFFKWQALPEILALRGQGGLALLEWGYMVLVATLVQALLASLLLILLPLWVHRRGHLKTPASMSSPRVLGYFFAIGLAFFFLEIAFIQKLILFLHHPLYAVGVALTAFLLFAAPGSLWSQRYVQAGRPRDGVRHAVLGLMALGLGYAFTLGPLFDLLMAWPVPVKVCVALALIAPLAFCMGMPFPLALATTSAHARALVPWAWGVNGCASVLGAMLAMLCAIHFGFTVVIVIALLLYGLAALGFPQPRQARDG